MGLAAKAATVPQKATPVRILIADDSPFVRRAIRFLLEANPGWEVCGEAANGQEALDRAMKLTPDIIILDLVMPVMNGLQAARRMAVAVPLSRFTSWNNEPGSMFGSFVSNGTW